MYQYPTSLNVVFVPGSGHVISLPRDQYPTVCIMAARLHKLVARFSLTRLKLQRWVLELSLQTSFFYVFFSDVFILAL